MGYSKEKRRKYMRDLYHRRRNECLRILGGKCVKCGTTEKLEFDHIDPKTKKYMMYELFRGSQKRIDEELPKLQLLCKDHHTEKTIKDRGQKSAVGSHGTLSSYRYCKCDLCKKAKRDSMRKYRFEKKLQLQLNILQDVG